jgi:hypothetical protein
LSNNLVMTAVNLQDFVNDAGNLELDKFFRSIFPEETVKQLEDYILRGVLL